MNLTSELQIRKLASELDTTDELIRQFSNNQKHNTSGFQIYESLLIRNRIMEKTLFDSMDSNPSFSIDDVEAQLEKNLYFVTVQFSRKYQGKQFEQDFQLAQANAIASLYKSMSKAIIDYPFSRNSKLLPFLQFYLDAENSRYSSISRDIDIPHHHGLMLVHPKTKKRFDNWLLESGQPVSVKGKPCVKLAVRNHAPIETVTFSKFNPAFGTLNRLISYVTKFARNDRFVNGAGDFLELSSVYPQVPKRLYPYYRNCKFPIFTEAEFLSFEKQN